MEKHHGAGSDLLHSDDISIVAGGWSATKIDMASLPGLVICVNDAALHCPRCDIIISMDRLWIEHRWDTLERFGLPTFVRLSAMRNIFENIRKPWVFPFDCRHDDPKFGEYSCTLNGPNSGHCALNLAYVMRPKRMHLAGFDMERGPNGEANWFPAYPWAKPEGATSNKRYAEWAGHFEKALRQFASAGIQVNSL